MTIKCKIIINCYVTTENMG